jgi:hypothetical protein
MASLTFGGNVGQAATSAAKPAPALPPSSSPLVRPVVRLAGSVGATSFSVKVLRRVLCRFPG